MTAIDHAAEARKHIDWAHEIQGEEGQTDRTVTDDALIAQVHATLALAEQARIANLIELANNAARMATEGKSDMADYLDLFRKVNPAIMEGLGL